jgi:hypothetical protein
MSDDIKTAAGPKLERMASTGRAAVIKDETARRATARKAYRAKIESLLDESRVERLAEVWQRVSPFPMDSTCELTDRRGIIADLADFAEALQPSLEGMKAHRLCRLIEKFATYQPRQSHLPVSLLARQMGTPNHRTGLDLNLANHCRR